VIAEELSKDVFHRARCEICTWNIVSRDVWAPVVQHVHEHHGHTVKYTVEYHSQTRVKAW